MNQHVRSTFMTERERVVQRLETPHHGLIYHCIMFLCAPLGDIYSEVMKTFLTKVGATFDDVPPPQQCQEAQQRQGALLAHSHRASKMQSQNVFPVKGKEKGFCCISDGYGTSTLGLEGAASGKKQHSDLVSVAHGVQRTLEVFKPDIQAERAGALQRCWNKQRNHAEFLEWLISNVQSPFEEFCLGKQSSGNPFHVRNVTEFLR